MKIVFMGTPDFAVPALEALIRGGHEVAAAVTQPDRPKGRGKAVLMPPVKETALQHGIPVLQPEKMRGHDHFPCRHRSQRIRGDFLIPQSDHQHTFNVSSAAENHLLQAIGHHGGGLIALILIVQIRQFHGDVLARFLINLIIAAMNDDMMSSDGAHTLFVMSKIIVFRQIEYFLISQVGSVSAHVVHLVVSMHPIPDVYPCSQLSFITDKKDRQVRNDAFPAVKTHVYIAFCLSF